MQATAILTLFQSPDEDSLVFCSAVACTHPPTKLTSFQSPDEDSLVFCLPGWLWSRCVRYEFQSPDEDSLVFCSSETIRRAAGAIAFQSPDEDSLVFCCGWVKHPGQPQTYEWFQSPDEDSLVFCPISDISTDGKLSAAQVSVP